jgi:oligopeptide transport system substrate-binding protein
LLASAAIIVAACGGATESSAPPASTEPGASGEASAPPEGGLAAEQILNVDIGGEPPTLDTNKAQDSNSIAMLSGLSRGLVYVDAENNVVPSLATSWEVSADAKTLTFTLGDYKYSNGEPIVAGDFVRSIKRLADPRTAAPYSYVAAETPARATCSPWPARIRFRRTPRSPRSSTSSVSAPPTTRPSSSPSRLRRATSCRR